MRRMAGNWTAIVVNYNGDTFLDACLIALQGVRLKPAEVIVVDNASTDDSLLELNGFPWANVLAQRENLGYAGGANVGLAAVETDYAVILNPDVELDPDFGRALVETFDARPRLGAAGALLLYPDGRTVQHAGGTIARPSLFTDHRGRGEPHSAKYEVEAEIEFATGAALCLRMSAVREIGGFDEQFTPAYYEDVDLCTRLARRGWEVRFIPALRGLHYEGVTLEKSPAYYSHIHRNRLRYALKHLSPAAWRREFVPAEVERLRHELKVATGEDWPATTGAGAIDTLLSTTGERHNWQHPSLLSEGTFPTEPPATDDLHPLLGRTAPFAPGDPSLLGRIGSLINFLPRWYLRRALSGQRAFNEALVRNLIDQQQLNLQQDRFNREQTASILLYALLTLDRLAHYESRVPEIPDPEHFQS